MKQILIPFRLSVLRNLDFKKPELVSFTDTSQMQVQDKSEISGVFPWLIKK